jgi:AraC-like DNA-binding protein
MSMLAYLAMAIVRYRRYQHWLGDNSGAREEYRLGWLRGFLIATASTLAVAIGFGAVHWAVRPLSYFDEFPLYVVFTLLVYYLGLEGWRNAALAYPPMDASAPDVEPIPDTRTLPVERDWQAMGRRWGDRIIAEQWWREPDVDLGGLARRLGTNTNYLSRALNEGLGMNLSEFINRQRVQAAQQALAQPGDILGIGLDVGFRSKASFNRAFKTHAGCTPSEWRERGVGKRPGS